MPSGFQIFDASGNSMFDGDDFTFRFVGDYTYTNNPTADVVVGVTGVNTSTHFASCVYGFPVVENGQVRIKPEFGSPAQSATLSIFRI